MLSLLSFRPCHTALRCVLVWGPLATLAGAQAPGNAPAAGVASSAERAVSLAQSGHCKEALPLLKQARPHVVDKDVKRSLGFAGVRCGMFADKPDAAEEFLLFLNREFPHDPAVLYLSVHTHSDLSIRAAADLATTAPKSAQGHELHAESLETQGKWDEAAKEYRLVLQQNPRLPGIHFRLGRLLLSKTKPTPEEAEEAKKEMQAELEIDPSNAGAEYVLGEMARQNQQWDEAIQHFSRAAKLDPGFGDAFVGWGGSLVSAKKYSDAIPPLEIGVKLQVGNPAAHYMLGIAYARTGRKEDGDREFAIQRKLTQKGAAGEPAAESQQSPN
jgi:tetratricopeptide (TPR) repeat protein